MSLTSLKIKSVLTLSAAAGVFLAVSPANAAGIKGQVDLVWNADATPTSIDFYTAIPNSPFPLNGPADDSRGDIGDIFVSSATQDFAALGGTGGVVKDLTSIPLASSVANWLDFDGTDFDFNLTSFEYVSSLEYVFEGFFNKSGSIGKGVLTTQVNGMGIKSYSITIDADGTQIPTPALLPGLLGMGAACLRKRKQQATVEA